MSYVFLIIVSIFGLLKKDFDHHIVTIIDGGSKVISFIVDGLLCDGGKERLFGWGRFNPTFKFIDSAEEIKVASKLSGEIKHLRIYDRYLRVSEAIANFKTGLNRN